MMIDSKTLAEREANAASLLFRSDRLDSWKEIATYLRREVRTVQLWEKNEQLPVHRHFHKHLGSVFAFRSEIDKWREEMSRRELADRSSPSGKSAKAADDDLVRTKDVKFHPAVTAEAAALASSILGKISKALSECVPSAIRAEHADLRKSWILSPNLDLDCDHLVLQLSLAAESGPVIWTHSSRWQLSSDLEAHELAIDEVVKCLWLKLVSLSAPPAPLVHKQHPCSREAYLRGRYFWNQRNEEGLRKAVGYFKSALRDDPEFALAHTGLADSLNLLSFYEIEPTSNTMPEARRAALRAIELDPNLAEGHASLADIYLHFDRDWAGADREYRQAIECNPSYALSYHWYANLLAAKGQHEAANAAMMQALDIDPVSLISWVWAGVTSYLARRYGTAIEHYRSALELNPQFIWAHTYLAQSLEQQGDFDGALGEFETAIRLTGGNRCLQAMKAHTLAMAGDDAAALRLISDVSNQPGQNWVPSYDVAAVYAALGDTDNSVKWLNRACADRNMKLFTLIQDPRFDPLRSHPEFRKIVGDVGLGGYFRS